MNRIMTTAVRPLTLFDVCCHTACTALPPARGVAVSDMNPPGSRCSLSAIVNVTEFDLINSLHPTAIGWFSQENIFAMDPTTNNLSPTARRFESGTPPIPNTYAALAGLNMIQHLGVEAIEDHVQTLTEALIEGALCAGYNVVTPVQPKQHGALITIKSNDVHQLVDRLGAQGIITSSRDNNLRVSPHFYNNLDDIDTVLAALKKNHDLLV